MDEIEYKLESKNPTLISHAISKLFDTIRRKKRDEQTVHISKIAEFKLLLTKRNSTDITLSISACQALIILVENRLWDINEALSTFTSNISFIKNYTVAAPIITRLLILDLKRDRGNKSMYPFTLHIPQHPFIIILIENKFSWQSVLNEMSFVVNHQDPRIKENGIEMLRPVFLYILCNPLWDSINHYAQKKAWQLLINSKHGIHVQRESLLWSYTTESQNCIDASYQILDLAEKALSEGNREYCTALLPMIASLTIHLLKRDSDPRPNFNTISAIIDHCDSCIGNLMLILMAEIVVLCPAIYLHSVLQICTTITKKMSCNDIFFNCLIASILKWMAYPSVLSSDALDTAKDLANGKIFDKRKWTDNERSSTTTVSSNRLFTLFTHSDPSLEFYNELVDCFDIWKPKDIIPWLKSMSLVPIDLKDKCKLLISGILLHTTESQVTELCCNILLDVSREGKGFCSHVLPLVLHKLTKSRNITESKCLLLVMPELAIAKENVPIITHTLDTLLNGDKQLKYFTIELYLKAFNREPRCYRFIDAAIIRLMKSDSCWYSNATCARAMKYICENNPEHGEKLVPLLSETLNRSTDANGGTASGLALRCISALCKASVIDVYSTWKVLVPKMKKEKRTIVLENLCQLFADIASYPHSQFTIEYDQLIDNVLSQLWEYATCNDGKVVDAALRALASYRLEQIPLKTLPLQFRENLAFPSTYKKTPIDADQKPEDILSYIPGTCWIQMLENINKATLSTAGNLLISFITEEVNSFRSGAYTFYQEEPHNFKYLPEKSVIRAVGEYLRRTNKSDPENRPIIIECLRIFAHKYPKPLPKINWHSILDNLQDISAEAKRYTLAIASHQVTISPSANYFIKNYLSTYISIDNSEFIWKANEHPILYENLEDLCQALQPSHVKPFLETTLEYVIGKMNSDDKDSTKCMFRCIMSSYGEALKNQEACDANAAILFVILENLLHKIDLTCDHFQPYFIAALKLPTESLERITSPKLWSEVTTDKLKNIIAIKAELALNKFSSDFSLTHLWLNEIVDQIAASTSSVQLYFLETMQRVLTKMQFEKSSIKWVLDFIAQIQGLLIESSQDSNNKVQFYCDVLCVSVVSLSGLDFLLMKRDLLITSQTTRLKLFPQALTLLSDRQDWKHAIPQLMEWLNYMRTSTVPSIYKSTFHRSLIRLRHDPHYKNVWTKYLSIKTDVDT